MEMYTNVLLVTANVGSLFENVSSPLHHQGYKLKLHVGVTLPEDCA